jgi:hypothetical protein
LAQHGRLHHRRAPTVLQMMASQRQPGHGKDMMQNHVLELGDGARSLRVKGIELEDYIRDVPVR